MMQAFKQKLVSNLGSWIYSVAIKRSEEIVTPILPWLQKRSDSILDFGCGLGHVGLLISQRTGRTITSLDVREYPYTSPGIQVKIFDGKTIPYPDRFFDTTLIALVLHHTPNPAETLREVLRVTNHSIIICEDLMLSRSEIVLEVIKDTIANGFAPHMTLQYKTEHEWEELFASFSLTIQEKEYFQSKFIFTFKNVAWWLTRDSSSQVLPS